MKHIARIFLLLSATALLAYYLPIGWHLLTGSRQRVPYIQYGETGAGFLFTGVKYENGEATVVYTDRAGNSYTRDAFEKMLPLTYSAQLYKNGTMPSEIKGVKITPGSIRREMFGFRIRPESLDTPGVELLTLFEAESGRARLEVPQDFMRILKDGRIEFPEPKNNSVNTEKSERFTNAFARAKFNFPVTAIGANANPRKPYDEGIYLADAEGQMFLLRQVRGEPEVTRIGDIAADPGAWRALKPRHIIVNEIETRELRALIIDTNGQPWLSVGEKHRLVKLPVESYTPAGATLSIRGNLLNRMLVVQTEEKQEAVALDREYKVIDRYEGDLTAPSALPPGKIGALLFPFTWWMTDDSSGYFGFYGKFGSALAFALNAVFLVLYIIWLRIRERKVSAVFVPDFIIIAAGGICGLLPALLLPRADVFRE